MPPVVHISESLVGQSTKCTCPEDIQQEEDIFLCYATLSFVLSEGMIDEVTVIE